MMEKNILIFVIFFSIKEWIQPKHLPKSANVSKGGSNLRETGSRQMLILVEQQ